MSILRTLFCCWCHNQDQTIPYKNFHKLLPEESDNLLKAKDQNQTLIYCLGQLSPLIHMQRLPLSIPDSHRFISQLAVGENHFMAVLGNGQMVGAGSNQYGQLGLPFKGQNGIQVVESLQVIDFEGLNTVKENKVYEIVAGRNHTAMVVKNISNQKKKIFAFGEEVGIGIDGVPHTHVPQEVNIPKMPDLQDLSFIYARYNTTLAVDHKGRVFMWGEDASNLRLRKPKLLSIFEKGVKQIALGKRHGILIDNASRVFGWGDGTYGELGLLEDLPIERPILIPFFKDLKIVQIAAGARHSLALDQEGNIYAMGDNSEDQCGISGRRATVPEKILKDFKTVRIFAGESHNVAMADDNNLYSWGGSVINASWIEQSSKESKLRLMEDLKRRKISIINVSYSNTVVITGQQ